MMGDDETSDYLQHCSCFAHPALNFTSKADVGVGTSLPWGLFVTHAIHHEAVRLLSRV